MKKLFLRLNHLINFNIKKLKKIVIPNDCDSNYVIILKLFWSETILLFIFSLILIKIDG